MDILVTAYTDVGIKKQTNQDALLVKTAKTALGKVALCVVCDGMGGLAKGELASATAVRELSAWFDSCLPGLITSDNISEAIGLDLCAVVNAANQKIFAYGQQNGVQLGTTLSAFLLLHNQYFIAQIGDSRVYEVNTKLTQLTKDQTVVAREVERGNITEEQAKKDPRKNILLQCVGATKQVDAVLSQGTAEKCTAFVMCSDGFYHELLDEELQEHLQPEKLVDQNQMQTTARNMVEMVKARNEQDNISVILLKTY